MRQPPDQPPAPGHAFHFCFFKLGAHENIVGIIDAEYGETRRCIVAGMDKLFCHHAVYGAFNPGVLKIKLCNLKAFVRPPLRFFLRRQDFFELRYVAFRRQSLLGVCWPLHAEAEERTPASRFLLGINSVERMLGNAFGLIQIFNAREIVLHPVKIRLRFFQIFLGFCNAALRNICFVVNHLRAF